MGISSSKDGNEDNSMQNSIPARTAPRGKYDEPTDRKNPLGSDAATHSFEDEDMGNIVPTVFKWEHGGRNVYITGNNHSCNIIHSIIFLIRYI